MEPVPLIFSCDTEDYETPASDDAELLWARLFARHGIRACFCVVGEEARALRDRGRRDVLAALAQHEIASHSNLHSAHPTPAEYLDGLSWRDGVRRFVQEEAPAVGDLRDLLGQQPSAWCKPGNSWGAAVPYAAALLGMPVFCDAPFEWAPGRPMRYAGELLPGPTGTSGPSVGGLLLRYHTSFDRYFRVPGAERQGQMRADFEALLESRLAEAEQEGRPPGIVVIYTHPCRTVTAAFPDNFTAGRNPPRSEWRPAPLRPQHEVDALVRDFDAFLGWIADLRASDRVVLTTYREVFERYRQPAEARLPLHGALELARAVAIDDSPIEPWKIAGQWLSPAEQYGVVAAALAHSAVWGSPPKEVPVRRLLGPIDYESLQAAAAQDASPVALPVVQRAAVEADERCSRDGAVPARIALPGSGGPGRALRLMSRALVAAAGPSRGIEVQSPKGNDETVLWRREDFQRLRFQGTWSIFPPDFKGERLIEQARWQTWSAKPA